MIFEQFTKGSRECFSILAKKAKIDSHKEKLANDDYKIIKCAEVIISAYMAEHPEAEMPYNVVELIGKRNTIRNDINALESKIEEIEIE